tara:strand:- start:113 stop:226 length:114 start_codon:yes stop_codon:yes gene_type:complete
MRQRRKHAREKAMPLSFRLTVLVTLLLEPPRLIPLQH